MKELKKRLCKALLDLAPKDPDFVVSFEDLARRLVPQVPQILYGLEKKGLIELKVSKLHGGLKVMDLEGLKRIIE